MRKPKGKVILSPLYIGEAPSIEPGNMSYSEIERAPIVGSRTRFCCLGSEDARAIPVEVRYINATLTLNAVARNSSSNKPVLVYYDPETTSTTEMKQFNKLLIGGGFEVEFSDAKTPGVVPYETTKSPDVIPKNTEPAKYKLGKH